MSNGSGGQVKGHAVGFNRNLPIHSRVSVPQVFPVLVTVQFTKNNHQEGRRGYDADALPGAILKRRLRWPQRPDTSAIAFGAGGVCIGI